jgi:hypothetical protein
MNRLDYHYHFAVTALQMQFSFFASVVVKKNTLFHFCPLNFMHIRTTYFTMLFIL